MTLSSNKTVTATFNVQPAAPRQRVAVRHPTGRRAGQRLPVLTGQRAAALAKCKKKKGKKRKKCKKKAAVAAGLSRRSGRRIISRHRPL